MILQAGSAALRAAGFDPMSAAMLAAARAASVPVAVHVDHGRDVAEVRRCLETGFTSVMVDGSALPFGENVAQAREVVAMAYPAGALAEAELGPLVGLEDAALPQDASQAYTDPREAERFVRESGVHALAVAIGNVHGFYKGEPHLDLDRLRQIAERTAIPLVLHGTSGLPDDLVGQAIALGIRKLNANAEVRAALFGTLERELPCRLADLDLVKLEAATVAAMRRVVEAKMDLFGSRGRA